MLKSIGSVIAGYLVMAVFTIAFFGILAVAAPGTFDMEKQTVPGTGWLIVILGAGLVAALAGGWVTARIAPRAAFQHAVALAALVVVLGILSSLGGPQPGWYKAGLPIVGCAGVLLGGRLRG